MDNSKIVQEANVFEEPKVDKELLEKKRSTYRMIVEASRGVENSKDWKTLKDLLFEGTVETLNKRIISEVGKKEIDTAELYRLQGQLMWAKKYVDLSQLAEFFSKQLEGIKHHEQNIPGDGASNGSRTEG